MPRNGQARALGKVTGDVPFFKDLAQTALLDEDSCHSKNQTDHSSCLTLNYLETIMTVAIWTTALFECSMFKK